MLFYGYGPLDLWNPVHVQRDVVTIYGHLRSRSMPIVRSEDEIWPEDALELLRAWANGGFRISSSDPAKPQVVIPKPVDPPAVIRVRKDILSLTDTELQMYRTKLEDILGCFALNSTWQELGLLRRFTFNSAKCGLNGEQMPNGVYTIRRVSCFGIEPC